MLRKSFFLIPFTVMLVSCSHNTRTDVIRKELPMADIIADSLFTQFPGTLRISSSHILLETPFDQDGFLKIYDKETGKEVDWIGSLGRGPGEWGTPSLGNMVNDQLVIYDLNEHKYVLAGMKNLYRDISNPDSIKKIDIAANRLNVANNKRIIVADFIDETYPFKILAKDTTVSFGKYPFDEKIINALDRLQGHILVHPEKNFMVYGVINHPYLSLYDINNSTSLLWENQFGIPDYTITNKVLTWGKNQQSGIDDISFTKDYIVCLVVDPEKKEVKYQTVMRGRTMSMSIRSIYLFDYQGRLSYILDLPFLAVRLASDTQSNTIYMVAIEPDYCIIKYDLSKFVI